MRLAGQTGTRLPAAAPQSQHPGGDHPKANQDRLYRKNHIVLRARMITFGYDAQLDRGSERAECAYTPPLSFTGPGVNRRSNGHAYHRRKHSPAVPEYPLAG